jgi:transposase
LSTRRIARLLGLSRGTVIRYAQSETFPERKRKKRQESILDPYLPYLEERVQAGCLNGQQLWREIVARGYPGSPSQVNKWMTWRRGQLTEPKAGQSPSKQPVSMLPSAKELASLLHRSNEKLDEADSWLLQHLRQIPTIAQLHDLTRSFSVMVREGLAENLDGWLSQCRNSELAALQRFAAGLAQVYDAVRAALESEWSNGQTEGQVNRLKLLKRQMYGRAKLDLLRKRMIYQP